MTQSATRFWDEVYSRNISKMIGICHRYTRDRQLAEDLAHDAFLKAIEKSSAFQGRGSFEGWLRRIVVNHVLSYIRDQGRHKVSLESESSFESTDENDVSLDSSGYPEFTEEELLEVIHSLPEHHRLVFNLYVIDRFTHGQIAEQLGISAGTSKSHLARARKRIKQLLAQRANEKREKRKYVLFLLPFKSNGVDHLYRKRFFDFELPPGKTSISDFSNAPLLNSVVSQGVTGLNYFLAAACVGVLAVVATVTYKHRAHGSEVVKKEVAQAIIPKENKSTALVPDSTKSKDDTTSIAQRNNFSRAATSAATFFKDSVIRSKTINSKRMKNLDSLGAILLLTSAIVFDSAGQATQVSAGNETQLVAQGGNQVTFGSASDSPKISNDTRSKPENGTFFANSLFWSEKNNELYFQGKSIVNVGKNNFVSDGSASFLGPVFLLVINDEEVKIGSTIKLSKEKYSLTRLSDSEAKRKYGEKGENGVVEIEEVGSRN